MTQITDETLRFIDISKWQTPASLKWAKLPANMSAVVSRSTYGRTKDPHFKAHFDATVDHVRAPGAYHFVTYDDPMSQWDAFEQQLDLVDYGDPGDLLPVLDCEWLPGEKAPADPARYLQNVNAMLRMCDSSYGGAIIYTAAGFWQQLGRPRNWLDRPLWCAHYPGDRSEAGSRAYADKVQTPHGVGKWRMWQSGPRYIPGFCASKIDYNYSTGPLPVIQ